MRRIVLLWLVLTPLWIAFSFYGSTAKIAFIPPALVVIVLVLYWLHRHFVIAVAGEPEPRARSVRPNPWPRRTLQTPAVAAPAIMAPPVTAPPPRSRVRAQTHVPWLRPTANHAADAVRGAAATSLSR